MLRQISLLKVETHQRPTEAYQPFQPPESCPLPCIALAPEAFFDTGGRALGFNSTCGFLEACLRLDSYGSGVL